jgi:two-component system, cell cycle sensor histidine kinase and response regulator CckA
VLPRLRRGKDTVTELAGNEVVLLADDEPAVRRLVRLALEQRGYRVVEASDGEEAVARFEERRGRIHIALLDLSMPRLGGVEALLAMRTLEPDLPAIFMSGHPDGPGLSEAPADVPLLAKPFRPDELAGRIHAALDHKRR